MPVPIVAGNWKMNTTLAQAAQLAAQVKAGVAGLTRVTVILCPPAVSLAVVRQAVWRSPVRLGAQNMHPDASGAFTGEIAPTMLTGLCQYVILGHSERRQLFGETDEFINRKVKAALQHGLRPILCVGETLAQRESGQAAAVVSRQIRAGLAGVSDPSSLVVAYEPVWAIGTGKAATPEIAEEIMGGAIHATLRSLYGAVADNTPLLYGGSVNPGNIEGFVRQPHVHGGLVGGASLNAAQFVEIARKTAAVKALK